MMPAGVFPPGIVHSFQGRAAPAPHNANIGERRPGCPHPAPRNLPVDGVRHRWERPRYGWFFVTAAFSIVTGFFGAGALSPSATPSLATFSTILRPAAPIFPKGV